MPNVPSYHTFNFQLPGKSRFEPWRGVFYPTRMGPRAILVHKIATQRQLDATQNSYATALANAEESHAKSLADGLGVWQKYQEMCKANGFGLSGNAMDHFDGLRTMPVPLHAYPALIKSFTAKDVYANLLKTTCNYDTTDATKKLGEINGGQRVDDACFVMETCYAKMTGGTAPDNVLLIHMFNALMGVMITGGYDNCRRVFNQTYDTLGAQKIQPTLDTYLLTMRALGLCGEVAEAKSIFTWLRKTVGTSLDIRAYHIMLECYKENKMMEQSDALWSELLDAQWPRVTVPTAEMYLRTLIDHAYTPLAGVMALYGQPYHAELKRIPLILQQLDQHGVPHHLFSPPVRHHIANAFISYKIGPALKYKWARSKSQFAFFEMRKENQYIQDVKELNNDNQALGQTHEAGAKDRAKMGSGVSEYNGVHGGKNSWERLPADDMFYHMQVDEHMKDTKSDPKGYIKRTDVYERSHQWMLDVPQTRYDQLYGAHKVDFHGMGIRRHLDARRPGSETDMGRDEALVHATAKLGRKVGKGRGDASVDRHEKNKFYREFVE